ncbi:flavin reductase family protein [Moraxella canis]|uniref:flavin reductase family protein n=1 Tax=Moraxella canis TaxID=90239 RepID=UPI0006686160|nr:flavin reductase family protein [Moraxella canis]
MVEKLIFKDAMARLATAVHVVTTDGDSGRHGFTASAVCSVTDSPPSLLVCMNAQARSYEHFVANRVLAVNTLTPEQAHLSGIFSSPLESDERFEYGEWEVLNTGAPILKEALATFDCHIEDIKDVGTHSIFICKIVGIRHADLSQQGLVYFDRAYHKAGQQTAFEPELTKPKPQSVI